MVSTGSSDCHDSPLIGSWFPGDGLAVCSLIFARMKIWKSEFWSRRLFSSTCTMKLESGMIKSVVYIDLSTCLFAFLSGLNRVTMMFLQQMEKTLKTLQLGRGSVFIPTRQVL